MNDTKKAFVPKYRQIFDLIKEGIHTYKYPPGSKVDSITEIQKKYSVSRETAKLVLKLLAQEGLIIQKTGKGSFVADLGPRKKIWGMILPYVVPNIEQLIHFLRKEAKSFGREFHYYLNYNNPEEEQRLVGNLIHEAYEAIIVVPVFNEAETAEFYQKLVTGSTKLILADHTMAGSHFRYVIQSYDLGVKRAVTYFAEQSKGNLLFIRDKSLPGYNMVQDFMEGSFENYAEILCADREVNYIDRLDEFSADYIREKQLGGVFCPNDMIAARVLGRIKSWGIDVPKDVNVVSYGNTELAAFFTPAITSVDGFHDQMAQKISTLIQMLLDDKEPDNSQQVILPELIVRET